MLTTARFLGGPCNNRYRQIDLHGSQPPGILSCGGSAYYYIENWRGDLLYGAPGYIDKYNAKAGAAARRDVFKSWRRLMHTLAFRNVHERQRVIRASERIRRAVR